MFPAVVLSVLFAPGPDSFCGTVVAILDCDTIEVLTLETKTVRIRLDGIDAPEKKQPFATKSRKALGDLVAEKIVRVQIKGEDRYKRKIGVVWLLDENVNVR